MDLLKVNKMEAKELRIGNYYEWTENVEEKDAFLQVDDFYSLLAIGENFQYFKPIPLTEEWLLKFGFDNRLLKKIGDSDLYLQGDNADSLKEYGVYLSTDIGDGLCSEPNTFIEGFFYVHQLQNLYFALTQTELKIK